MVARNWCRMIAAGTAAHSDHGSHLLEAFDLIAQGKTAGHFAIREPKKLTALAQRLGVVLEENEEIRSIATKLVVQLHKEFAGTGVESAWIRNTIPEIRLKKLREILSKLPSGIDPMIRETLSRTNMGMDADPLNLLLGGIRCSLGDFVGMDISTHLSDTLLGTPKPTFSKGSLGVLDAKAVNIAVHGHNPLISESIMNELPNFQEQAKAAGAENGINIVGVCCTGNELLTRHGIPLAANSGSQELVILTGAVEAMVVDVQCIMPSLAELCSCYHTQLITTMETAKIPGAIHREFHPETSIQHAQDILSLAIDRFKVRDAKRVHIPDIQKETMLGFSAESIVELLTKINPTNPVQVLIDKIVSGDIQGIVLFAGCNNFKVMQDSGFLTLARELARDNVLLLATGCAAGAFAKAGYLSPWATLEICGNRLKGVLEALGNVAGIGRPLPPVWHMGSCVDNSRAAHLAFAVANTLGVDIDKLPIVVSAPEIMHEKALTIGTWALSMGLTTHVGIAPPVLGGKMVTKILTETAQELMGAKLIIEPDLNAAYQAIKNTLMNKRTALGLSCDGMIESQ